MVILPVGHIRAVLKLKNNITLTVTVCIASFIGNRDSIIHASFEAIGELQRERLRQSRATAFSWNGQMCGQFLQAKR